jgi:hypothetical protein
MSGGGYLISLLQPASSSTGGMAGARLGYRSHGNLKFRNDGLAVEFVGKGQSYSDIIVSIGV